MRRKLSFAASALAVAFLVGCTPDTANAPTGPDGGKVLADLGNGYPAPGHDFQMQLIGVPHDKTADMDNNNGHRIFVQLYSPSSDSVTTPGGKNNHLGKDGLTNQNQIYLCNSTANENDVTGALGEQCDAWRADGHQGDFGVIDANATDGDGALFGLPDPCAGVSSIDGCTPTYRIWARYLAGKGDAIMTLCADETGTGFDGTDDVWCGSNGITFTKQDYQKAREVTSNLLSMVITINDAVDAELADCIGGQQATDSDADQVTVWLFDQCFENYFWMYDNNGLKNLQLRFYFVGNL